MEPRNGNSSTPSAALEIVVHLPQQDTAQSSESGSSCSKQNRNQHMWLPSLILLGERDKVKHQLRLDLLKAALEGNIEEAESLISQNSSMSLSSAAITEGQETIFHVAAGAKQTNFVEKMIKLMANNDLKLQNEKGNTAFCFAAMAGSKSVAEKMLEKDNNLLEIRGAEQLTPLNLAASSGQREMALFLYRQHYKYKGILTGEDKKNIFFTSIDTTLYDLAFELLQDDNENELAMAYYGEAFPTPLHRLALTPLHLLDQSSKSDKTVLINQALELVKLLWEKILEKEGNQVWIYFNKHRNLLFDAAHLGNFRFLAELISLYPDLVHQRDDNQCTIFHIAIMHRYDDLFKLIHKIGFNKQLIAAYLDKDKNSLLHLAAKYPNPKPLSTVSGAALEMQRESRIFKDVEMLVMPSYRELKNIDNKTPRELFTSTHEDLLKSGQKWMRNTASQCILVATIIATVVFQAAFTIPGGNNDNGIPIHQRNIVCRVFAMADAIALSSSSISILMFLSILTSRYAENDFYRSLPLKLVVGLLTLFISIATMMLAFIPSFYIAYDHNKSNAIPILATIFVFFPVFIFGLSQYSLLRDVLYYSTLHFRVPLSQDNARDQLK